MSSRPIFMDDLKTMGFAYQNPDEATEGGAWSTEDAWLDDDRQVVAMTYKAWRSIQPTMWLFCMQYVGLHA